MRRLGIAAIAALSLYGAVDLVSTVYRHLTPSEEAKPQERYQLLLGYCNPELNSCRSAIPQITLRRESDARMLLDVTFTNYFGSNRPYIHAVWTDPELSDMLGGELSVVVTGSPR
ncbi:MAG TPA: hypothetical protein VJI15_04815 [Candidatus Nanoarchaeia archaeon]|nr:hypothetical protein [Candidatus Nanoarchaeia archaeon]